MLRHAISTPLRIMPLYRCQNSLKPASSRLGVPAAPGGHGGDVTDAVAAIAAVSECSLAAGFVFRGHRTFIEYLLQSSNEALRNKLLPGLLAGSRAGATGLSNAMKFLSGIEGLQIKARDRMTTQAVLEDH